MIAAEIVAWYRGARRDLPWRRTADPYAIWVSEIMLQQTRVAAVIPYWERWMARFPSVAALAAAPLDDVLAAWSGLGYYSRARNLHRGAREVVTRWGGALPGSARALRDVPGIGAYTAGAIASIAFGEAAPLVDGNVARVLARITALEVDVKSTAGQRALWALAGEVMAGLPDGAAPGDLNQGLMELGATVCAPRAPACTACPVSGRCAARAAGRQDQLPVMPARRTDIPVLARVALWIARGDRVVLARRRPEGLYGGLWELPEAASIPGVTIAEPMFRHQQVLTHRRVVVHVVRATVRGRLVAPEESGYDAVAWHAVSDVLDGGVGAATLTRAILERTRLDPWSSTPRRWPSSPRATRRSSKASAPSATISRTTTSATPRSARRAASTSSSTTTPRSPPRPRR